MNTIAITRTVSRAFERCELSHLPRCAIDLDLARHQHEEYGRALRTAGCDVKQLPEQPDLPDSVFVEDTAVVLEQVAVLARPGAASRRGEVESVASALAKWRELRYIRSPGTLDGGDVLTLGHVIYVGASARSNAEGCAQLARLVEPFGYTVESVPVRGCLHLKSAVTQITSDRLLLNPEWVDAACFSGWDAVMVGPAEPYGANALLIGDKVIYSSSHARTGSRLRQLGIDVLTVAMSEAEKAEGAVTCGSIVFQA